MLYGMFPEVLMAASAAEKEEILKNYRNTYFLRDILQMANLENQEGLYAIFQNLCRSLGSHLEVSNFAREAALSMPTAKKYLNTLQMSQLTFKLYGWQFGPAKRYIRAAKTYFTDNGIIQAFSAKVSQGQLLENFVISELEKRRKLGFINADHFYYYKTPAGKEIDLVFAAGGIVYAVEIKAAKAPSVKDISSVRDFVQSSEQPARGFIFYLGENYDEIDGIKLVPVTALFTSCGLTG
jgi:predicted AAA+ superfamily ATPase